MMLFYVAAVRMVHMTPFSQSKTTGKAASLTSIMLQYEADALGFPFHLQYKTKRDNTR